MLNPATRESITNALASDLSEVRLIAKGDRQMYELGLADGRQVLLRVPSFNESASIVEAEAATLRYLADRSDDEQSTTCYALLEKPSGICVESVFPSMTPFEQNVIITALARWMVELFKHRFEAIVSIDRGPFASARAYYRACAQRELDSSRMLFVQDAPESYQQELEESRLIVERISGLLCDLTNRCEGLDDDDPEMAPFSLDIHHVGLKNIFVSPENPTNILSVADWQYVNARPLWCCARLPPWLRPSLTATSGDSSRLAAIFKAEVVRVAGINSTFLRSLDLEDTRSTLDDLSAYDAFRDGFLLLPALENILATLPGHEDVAGLTALLDPSTLPGRVARINLLTRGSNAMYLAMTPPRSPLVTPAQDESTDKGMPSDSLLLVS
ncbi:hypothetical protein C8T65DRAFT_636307 [Cerioporus squamosus]|nr:hypothetical protein C8T65DRAFT_636307 [Cerioporus squamosus]